MALSLFLSLFAIEIAHSDGVPQNWVPEAIVLPDDAAVTMDRKVGSSIRMFAFSTGVDVETLFTGWPTALEKSGYDIRPQQPDLGATMIEFSGLGILNAKISVGAATGGNRVVITFDATLE